MINFAVVVPLANEADTFDEFTSRLMNVLDFIGYGTIYFVVDNVSKDNTLEKCYSLSDQDKRFNTIWAPQNENVVEAYLKGYEIALNNNHKIIILSKDEYHPPELTNFDELTINKSFLIVKKQEQKRIKNNYVDEISIENKTNIQFQLKL